MENISLKIQTGETSIELSGDSITIKEFFDDIKNNGLGILGSSQKKEDQIKKVEKIETKLSERKISDNKRKISKASKTKASVISRYENIDLGLDANKRQELKEYYSNFKLSTNVQKIYVLSYWLKEVANITEIDTNTIFSALRIVGEKVSFNIPQAFTDIQHRNQYLISTGEKGKYKITPIGEDYVNYELSKKDK